MEAYNNENTYGEDDQFFEKPSRFFFSIVLQSNEIMDVNKKTT